MRMQSDAATRLQDRGDFDRQIQFDSSPDLSVAARLMRNSFGGNHQSSLVRNTVQCRSDICPFATTVSNQHDDYTAAPNS
jgi:hypothetical protein